MFIFLSKMTGKICKRFIRPADGAFSREKHGPGGALSTTVPLQPLYLTPEISRNEPNYLLSVSKGIFFSFSLFSILAVKDSFVPWTARSRSERCMAQAALFLPRCHSPNHVQETNPNIFPFRIFFLARRVHHQREARHSHCSLHNGASSTTPTICSLFSMGYFPLFLFIFLFICFRFLLSKIHPPRGLRVLDPREARRRRRSFYHGAS